MPGSATFTLHRGEIVGIAGLVGAGRTRFLRTLFGLEPVRSGRIRLGVYSGPAAPAARWRQGMGMVSEDRAGEGLALGLERRREPDGVEARRTRAWIRRAAVARGRGGAALDRPSRHPLRQSPPADDRALRRQSTESRGRAVAASRRRRPRPRRADTRDRRRAARRKSTRSSTSWWGQTGQTRVRPWSDPVCPRGPKP